MIYHRSIYSLSLVISFSVVAFHQEQLKVKRELITLPKAEHRKMSIVEGFSIQCYVSIKFSFQDFSIVLFLFGWENVLAWRRYTREKKICKYIYFFILSLSLIAFDAVISSFLSVNIHNILRETTKNVTLESTEIMKM